MRIDAKTKRDVRVILEGMGLDLSTAVKMFCKQIQKTRTLPFEFNQCPYSHALSEKKVRTLRKAIHETPSDGKRFKSVQSLMRELDA